MGGAAIGVKIYADLLEYAGCGGSFDDHACSKIMRNTMLLQVVAKCRHAHARLHTLLHTLIDERMRRVALRFRPQDGGYNRSV